MHSFLLSLLTINYCFLIQNLSPFWLLYKQVENLSQQLNEQKLRVDSQESELISKRKELDDLKLEESKLELKLDSYKREAENASKIAGNTQLEISHIRTKLMELEEYERRLNDAITNIDSAVSSNDIFKINSLLPRTITPPINETLNPVNQNGFNAFESDTFGQKQTVLKSSEFVSDPFAGEDPFKGLISISFNLNSSLKRTNLKIDWFVTEEDPFKSDDRVSDPFSSQGFANFGSQEAASEPFDPFGTGSFSSTNRVSFMRKTTKSLLHQINFWTLYPVGPFRCRSVHITNSDPSRKIRESDTSTSTKEK